MIRVVTILSICISAVQLMAQTYYRLERLQINSPVYNEMAPAFYKDGILFSSDRKYDIVQVTKDQDDSYLYNIYYTKRIGKRNWDRPSLFSKDISSRYNESSVCFSPDSTEIYFTKTMVQSNKVSDIDLTDTLKFGIFYASLNGEDWGIPKSFEYNNDEYNTGYPNISSDGKLLFFCSENQDGYGGYDIYVCERDNGRWQKPENLGDLINTVENEVFPFFHESGRLFFGSRGHDDEKGMDIFYSDYINNEWIKPVKLPGPFNSRDDDYAYIANRDMDFGYFTSNRRGTDDIYRFTSAVPAFIDCPYQVEEEYCYEFYESGTMDLDTTSLKYEWDLGDGTKVRDVVANHCYAEPGFYLVQLNVIDTLTGDIYFSEASYDLLIEKLEQPYITCPEEAVVGQEITFDASQSNINAFTIENYYWDFGEGTISLESPVKHTYTRAGEYIIRLGVTDGEEENMRKRCVLKNIRIIE